MPFLQTLAAGSVRGFRDKKQITAPVGTLENPGTSALHVLNSDPEATSGLYYLKWGNMTAPAQVYCEMEKQGGGWMILAQHQCIDDQGLYKDLLTTQNGTPNIGSSNFSGCIQTNSTTQTPSDMWNNLLGNGGSATAEVFAREIQTGGGTYDEAQRYVSSSGAPIFSWSNFNNLFTAASGYPASGTYQTGINVIYRNGTRLASGKQQTVWSAPSLITINNGAVDQELYYCNGQDGGDGNWSFALMQGGTPYPRTANAANGGARHGGITRWGIIGVKGNDYTSPVDPFNDDSGIAYFPFTGSAGNRCIGENQWNGSFAGSGSYDSTNGLSFSGSGANAFVIPAPSNSGGTGQSVAEWFSGNQNWTVSMWFYLNTSPASATNRALMHMSRGNDHDRPGLWVTGPNRGAGTANKLEFFSSSNGTSWDIAKGDTDPSGLGSTTINSGQWYHITFGRDGSGLRAYLNGNLEWSSSNTSSHYDAGDYEVVIGNWFQIGNGYGWDGKIRHLRFFKKNLSQSEAQTLYNDGI